MDDYSAELVAAYDRLPQWRQDQFQAAMREAVEVIRRICDWMEQWEAAGIDAAEEHANDEDPA